MDLVLGLTVKVAFFLLKWSWNFLRLIALFLIVLVGACCVGAIVEVVRAPEPVRYFSDPYVCGQISGYMVRYPKLYLKYWAEYEGKSSFEPGFIHNKKGCWANLNSLTLVASWPEMAPLGMDHGVLVYNSNFTGILMTIRPLLPIFKGMRRVLETKLEDLTAQQRTTVRYLNEMGLYHVRGNGPVFEDTYSEFYWSERGGQVEHVIYCPWLDIQKEYSDCMATFLVPELGGYMEVEFAFEKMAYWREVVDASVAFMVEGLIGSN